MVYLGDFPVNGMVDLKWNSAGANGASITRATNGSIRIYKNNSTTERSSANGITDTEDFDTQTGMHHCRIDLSDNTDAGFYAAGSEYQVTLSAATIDGQVVNAVLAHFSIERTGGVLAILKRSPVRGTVGSSSTTTNIVTSSLDPAAAVTDQFKGRIVIFDRATTTANLRGQGSRITASTSGGELTVEALTNAPASGDQFSIF